MEKFLNSKQMSNKLCFVAGTEVTMEDYYTKYIEDIRIGDFVLSYNEKTQEIEVKEVIEVSTSIHNDLIKLILENDIEIISTFDHPYYVEGKHLASYKPNLTSARYTFTSEINQLKVGDSLIDLELENVKLVDLEEQEREPVQTYIFHVEDNSNFFANGILVRNKNV